MEFFKIVRVTTSETEIQNLITLSSLDTYSSELFPLQEAEANQVRIGGVWGEFTLTRNQIAGGLRFALQECPNALTWTITTGFPPEPKAIVIHLTVNRQEREQDFVEEIQEFLEDLSKGMLNIFSPVEQPLEKDYI